jgi:hypothetical protein
LGAVVHESAISLVQWLPIMSKCYCLSSAERSVAVSQRH